MSTRSHPRPNEDVRVVKETVSRSVGAIRMGSNPIPRKEFVRSLKTNWWRRSSDGLGKPPLNRVSSVGRASGF